MPGSETNNDLPLLLTRKEAANLLRMSVRWLSLGNGPRETRIGRRVFYLREDCMNFIRSQRAATRRAASAGG